MLFVMMRISKHPRASLRSGANSTRLLTLSASTTGSCTLGLLHHTQIVCELFALASDSADGVGRLIMRWHHVWSSCHFEYVMK